MPVNQDHINLHFHPGLYAEVHRWWQTSEYAEYSFSAAVSALICAALAMPASVKKSWPRDHGGMEHVGAMNGSNTKIWLPSGVRAQIASHQRRYGLPSLAAAVRELLRAALGVPPPEPALRPHGRSGCPAAMKKAIRRMAAHDVPPVAIADRLGVSRQYVSKIIRQAAANADV